MVRTGPPEFYPTSEELAAARQSLCGAPPLSESNQQRAVEVRPHYPACEFPDYACGCGAAEDRRALAAALDAAEQRGAERVAQRMRELAEVPPDSHYSPDYWRGYRRAMHRIRAALADVAPPTAGREGRP